MTADIYSSPTAQARLYLADSRSMPEVADDSIALAVTSPPYYAIKDYGVVGQIGHGQSLHSYLIDLYRVWAECYRGLLPGGRLCVNIGDQFARAAQFGRYKVIPLHAEIILQAEQIGFDYMGAIIWQKRTTMETTGGAVVMGSYPYPPNGIVELDYEFILLFKKAGRRRIPREQREASQMTKEEWKTYFSGHWSFGGARQQGHEAMFPEELPRRLIRMFTVAGDVVLDPFLGSGTTAQAALLLGRSAVGYEINPEFRPLIEERLKGEGSAWRASFTVPSRPEMLLEPVDYVPALPDFSPEVQGDVPFREPLVKVVAVVDALRLRLEGGEEICLLGVRVAPEQMAEAVQYLERYVRGRYVRLRRPLPDSADGAYVYLKNGLFVNRKMIEMGVAQADEQQLHPFRERFLRAREA